MARIKQKYATKSKKQQYYQIILDRISRSIYKSQDIITIQSLISEFDVSKSPVREALLELCDEGLLRSIPKFGYEVVSLEDDFINQIFDFRLLLESSAMDKYFDLIGDEEIKVLEELVLSADEVYDSNTPLENWNLSSSFHLQLISSYKNDYIYSQLESALRYLGIAHARSYWTNKITQRKNPSSESHKKIIEFIKNRDKENALICLKADLLI